MDTKNYKTTLVATDRIGREMALTIRLDETTHTRLVLADQAGELKEDVNAMLDAYHHQGPGYYAGVLSASQYRRLRQYLDTLHHVYYRYTLTLRD